MILNTVISHIENKAVKIPTHLAFWPSICLLNFPNGCWLRCRVRNDPAWAMIFVDKEDRL